MNINNLNICIIGAGRLAYSLIAALLSHKYRLLAAFTRTESSKNELEARFALTVSTATFAHIPAETNLVIICTNDQNIPAVAAQIAAQAPHLSAETVFLHTSGSVSLDALHVLGENIGVCYPLQIFTKEKIVDLGDTPIFYEGRGKAKEMAQKLAENLSQKIYFADSIQRKQIHLGAVFACNFTHYMYRIAEKLLPENADLSVYQALISEQLTKVYEFGAENTQTGPAQRGDIQTLQNHLQLLEKEQEWQDIYREMSIAINPTLKEKI